MIKHMVKEERGQQIILLALLLPVILGMVGLVVDLGMLYARRQQAQNAADAAALAGSAALCTTGSAAAQTIAKEYVTRNGFLASTATVTFPTLSAGYNNYVRVAIADTYEPLVASVVWSGTFPVKAKATAGCSGTGGMGTVLILNKTAAQSLYLNGSTNINVSKGNIHVDSNHSQGVYINGANKLISQYALTTVASTYRVNGSNTITPWPIVTGAPYKADPLADVPEPTYDASGAGYTPRANPNYNGSGPFATLQPGIYSSGISTNGSATINFAPGNYIIKGAGISINGSSPVNFGAGNYIIQGSGGTSGLLINGTGLINFGSGMWIIKGTDVRWNGNQTLKGTNIFFYIDAGTTLTINGTVSFSFSPPSTGTYKGILWFQKRSNTNTATLNGTPTVDGYGGIHYFPSATLNLNGTGYYDMSMIVDKFNANGSQQITLRGWSGVQPINPTWGLVE